MAVGAGVLAVVAALSGLAFSNLVAARHTLLGEVDPASLTADRLELAYLDQETGVRGYVLSATPGFLRPYTTGRKEQRSAATALNQDLADLPDVLQLAKLTEGQAAIWQHRFAEPAIAAVAGGDKGSITVVSQLRGKRLFDLVRARFGTLDDALADNRAAAGRQLDSATNLLIGILVAGLVLLVAAGVAMQQALRRWVTDPLLQVGGDARQVADGAVDHPIAPAGPPEFQELAGDVEAMRERIVTELQEVATAQADLADRNRELARSNVELEQFAYVASHDLQEPLRKVTSFVQLLQQRYQGQLDDRADEFIGFAADGAKRMQVLINDLLAFSRVGRTTERFVPVDLATAVTSALGNLATAVDEAGARVEVGDLPAVMGDPGLLTALWQNLIGNAVKFRRTDPPVVRIGVVDDQPPTTEPVAPTAGAVAVPAAGEASAAGPVGAAEPVATWTFEVADNGIGIEPRFADKIFVIFQRLHSRDSYAGTGIGLALAKKIVEFHGGTIWLDPRYGVDPGDGEGARLCFTLPRLEEGFTLRGPDEGADG